MSTSNSFFNSTSGAPSTPGASAAAPQGMAGGPAPTPTAPGGQYAMPTPGAGRRSIGDLIVALVPVIVPLIAQAWQRTPAGKRFFQTSEFWLLVVGSWSGSILGAVQEWITPATALVVSTVCTALYTIIRAATKQAAGANAQELATQAASYAATAILGHSEHPMAGAEMEAAIDHTLRSMGAIGVLAEGRTTPATPPAALPCELGASPLPGAGGGAKGISPTSPIPANGAQGEPATGLNNSLHETKPPENLLLRIIPWKRLSSLPGFSGPNESWVVEVRGSRGRGDELLCGHFRENNNTKALLICVPPANAFVPGEGAYILVSEYAGGQVQSNVGELQGRFPRLEYICNVSDEVGKKEMEVGA